MSTVSNCFFYNSTSSFSAPVSLLSSSLLSSRSSSCSVTLFSIRLLSSSSVHLPNVSHILRLISPIQTNRRVVHWATEWERHNDEWVRHHTFKNVLFAVFAVNAVKGTDLKERYCLFVLLLLLFSSSSFILSFFLLIILLLLPLSSHVFRLRPFQSLLTPHRSTSDILALPMIRREKGWWYQIQRNTNEERK